jgi:hypothetical protein
MLVSSIDCAFSTIFDWIMERFGVIFVFHFILNYQYWNAVNMFSPKEHLSIAMLIVEIFFSFHTLYVLYENVLDD